MRSADAELQTVRLPRLLCYPTIELVHRVPARRQHFLAVCSAFTACLFPCLAVAFCLSACRIALTPVDDLMSRPAAAAKRQPPLCSILHPDL